MSIDDVADVGSYASAEAAAGWQRGAAERAQYLRPSTDRMLDMAGVGRGSRVLDVGAGTGEQTLQAAARVGVEGYVLATDVASQMLEVAAEEARAAGSAQVETRVLDARNLDLAEASFDAAICRMALMLFPERSRVVAGIHRALKRGGKFATLVISTAERNPYTSVPMLIASRHAGVPLSSQADPGFFALADPTLLRACLESAGFTEVVVDAVPTLRRFPSIAAAVQDRRDSLPEVNNLLGATSEDVRQQAWREISMMVRGFETTDGVTVPGELLLAAGTK